MDLFELAVQQYLSRDRGIFLSYQYLIGERGVWEGCPDFLAINFPERQVWMVEVTKAPGSKIRNKIALFEAEYKPRIKTQLRNHLVIGGESSWSFGVWLFVPESMKRSVVPLADTPFKVTSLEEAVFPIGDYYRD